MSQPNRKIVSLESRAVAELNNVQRTKDASSHRPAGKALNRVLWSVQILLALGLLVIMTGATVTSFVGGQVAPAVITIVIAAVLIFAGYNRWKVSPHRNRRA